MSTRNLRTSVLFLLLVTSSCLVAQIYEKLNGPYGGGDKVYEAQTGFLFQFFNLDGIHRSVYRSNDGGYSWTLLPTPPASQLTDPISVGFDGQLYCAWNFNVYRSGNNGQSWNLLKSPSNTFTVGISSLPDGTILVTKSDQLYYSKDLGQSWASSPIGGIKAFYADDVTGRFYILNESDVYYSKDSAKTWIHFASGTFNASRTDIATTSNGNVFVSTFGRIMRFDSLGNLIRYIDPNPSVTDEVSLAICGNKRLFVSEGDVAAYSDNFGDQLIKCSAPGAHTFGLFSCTNSGNVFAKSSTGSIYQSDAKVLQWSFSAFKIPYARVLEVDFLNEQHILALSSDGLFYSNDNGLNWNLVSPCFLRPPQPNLVERIVPVGQSFYFLNENALLYYKNTNSTPVKIKDVANLNSALYYNVANTSLFLKEGLQLFRSIDQGTSWTSSYSGDFDELYTFSDGTLLLKSFKEVLRSSDNGKNWQLSTPIGLQLKSSLSGNGFNSAYIYQIQNNSLWRVLHSQDGGLTWSAQSIATPYSSLIEPYNGFICNQADQLFVSSVSNRILQSNDHGANQNEYINELITFRRLQLSPQQKLYMLTYGDGLYRTKTNTVSGPILLGALFQDQNGDCKKNGQESGLANRIIQATQGNEISYGYSNGLGQFRLALKKGDYTIVAKQSGTLFQSCSELVSTTSYNFKDTLPLGVSVLHTCPYLHVYLQADRFRPCTETYLYVDYRNDGTATAKDAFVEIELDPGLEYISSDLPYSQKNGSRFRFELGNLDIEQIGFFRVRVKVACTALPGDELCASAHIYPDTICGGDSIQHITASAQCMGSQINLRLENKTNQAMAEARNWYLVDRSLSAQNIHIVEGGRFQLAPSEVYEKRVNSGDDLTFMVEMDELQGAIQHAIIDIDHCSVSGSHIVQRDEQSESLSLFCQQVRASYDPNDITAYPQGMTTHKYIDAGQDMEYRIRFQNTGNDTAFNVRIENPIPTDQLDLSSFRAGASSHPYQLTIAPSGKLIFSFGHIMLPDSSVNETASHGFVSYKIRAKKALQKNTRILNQAEIFFDYNPGVKTNVEYNTIGWPAILTNNKDAEGHLTLMEVQPNPANEHVFVRIRETESTGWKLVLINAVQQVLFSTSGIQSALDVDVSTMDPGIYYLLLKNKQGEIVEMQKLVIMK